MNFLKQHLALIIPLVALLFSLQFYFTVERVNKGYEENLKESYSIVIAAQSDLDPRILKDTIKSVDTIIEIEPDFVLEKLKDGVSSANLALLKVSLPKFYKLTLQTLPSPEELEGMAEKLKKIKGVNRVETFAKSHTNTYTLLRFINGISKVFAVLIFIISFLLMVKQVEIWKFEHIERMEIMSLFGASFAMRSARLFRLGMVDALISAVLVAYIYFEALRYPKVEEILEKIGIEGSVYYPLSDALVMCGVALSISLVTVLFVISKERR